MGVTEHECCICKECQHEDYITGWHSCSECGKAICDHCSIDPECKPDYDNDDEDYNNEECQNTDHKQTCNDCEQKKMFLNNMVTIVKDIEKLTLSMNLLINRYRND